VEAGVWENAGMAPKHKAPKHKAARNASGKKRDFIMRFLVSHNRFVFIRNFKSSFI
jgi:hypothetical protein